MSENTQIEKTPEQDILSGRCPECGKLIPIRITLAGSGIDEHYISIDGHSQKPGKALFPDFEIGLDVDLLGLRYEGGLDEIIRGLTPEMKKIHLRRYDYNKLQGVYTKSAAPISLDEFRSDVKGTLEDIREKARSD